MTDVVDFEVTISVTRMATAIAERKFEDAAAEQRQIDAWMNIFANLEKHAKPKPQKR
jgi:hypothetical protein